MKKYKYTCIISSAYSLLQYLLQTDDEDGSKTFFFVDDFALLPSIYQNLPNKYVFKNGNPIRLLWFRLKCLFRWRFIRNTKIFAIDFLTPAPMLIGANKYTLLEEAPNLYTRKLEPKNDIYNPDCLFYPSILEKIPHKKGGVLDITTKQSKLWKIYSRTTHGRIYRDTLGTNSQCENRFYTNKKEESSAFLSNCEATYLNYRELWSKASENKKQFISSVFGLTPDMLSLIKDAKTIVYTNPLMEDCGLTEEEVFSIYHPYIEKYESDGLVIKPHPREKAFDYSKFFPNSFVFPKIVPSQLFDLYNIEFKTAITVFSSAITSLPADTKIVWIGTKIHPRIFEKWGDFPCPEKFTNVERIS